jgi:hypothetical protein
VTWTLSTRRVSKQIKEQFDEDMTEVIERVKQGQGQRRRNVVPFIEEVPMKAIVVNMNDISKFGVTLGVIMVAIIVSGSVLQNTFNPAESKKTLCAEMVGHMNWLSIFNIRTDGLKADYSQQCSGAGK